MDRRTALLADLNLKASRGLEIGPLTAPIVSKQEGRVEYVDHLSTNELRRKYAQEQTIDVNQIPVIDHVLEEGKLPRRLIGGNYDYIIASHVFEHLPNPLGWLRDCASILRTEGRLCLVVPDKRFTFDYSRTLTTLGEWIESDLLDQRRPNPRQIFEAATSSARIEAGITWKRAPRADELPATSTEADSFGLLKAQEGCNDYLDIHCTVYTPGSLLHLLARASRLSLHPFRLRRFYDTPCNGIEFYLQLENAGRDLADEREASFLNALVGSDDNPEPWKQAAARTPGSMMGSLLERVQSFNARIAHRRLRLRTGNRENGKAGSLSAEQRATGEHWDRVLAEGSSGLRLHWWEDPTTVRHINRLVCGKALEGLHTGFHQRILEKLPSQKATIRALSVGCGTGSKEIDLIKAAAGQLRFDFHCFDVAPGAIEAGRQMAREQGIDDQIQFFLADAFQTPLDEGWDLVYWNNSLHHMLNTPAAISWSYQRLSEGGLLAIDDYVGPDRFQWSDATINKASELLQRLTPQQRRHPLQPGRTVRERGGRPPIEAVISTDPTEAADSARIHGALQRRFGDNLEWIPTGGLAYLICLDELFENFQSNKEIEQLQSLLDADAEWGQIGETAYAVALATKKTLAELTPGLKGKCRQVNKTRL